MPLNKQKMIVDLLTGQAVDVDAESELKPHIKGFGSDTLNLLSTDDLDSLKPLALNYDKTQVSGTYVRNPVNGHTLLKLDEYPEGPMEDRYIDIINTIFPDEKERDNSDTVRISLFLPTEAADDNSEGNSWTHYHIKPGDVERENSSEVLQGLTSVIHDPDSDYGIRLFTALHLLGLAKTQFKTNGKAFFPRLIQSANLFPQFDIFSDEKTAEMKLHLKLLKSLSDKLYRFGSASEASRPTKKAKLVEALQNAKAKLKNSKAEPTAIADKLIGLKSADNLYEDVIQRFSGMLKYPAMPSPDKPGAFSREGKGYYIFPQSSRGAKAEQTVKQWQKDIISFESQNLLEYDTFELPADNASKTKKAEATRQKVLEGVSYMMSIFSGYIVTLEFKRDDIAAGQTGKKKTLSSISQPALLAPPELTDMLLDLNDLNVQLDNIIFTIVTQLDRRKKARNKAREAEEIELRSPYSEYLLKAKGYLQDTVVSIKRQDVSFAGIGSRISFPIPLKSLFGADYKRPRKFIEGVTHLVPIYRTYPLENLSDYQYPISVAKYRNARDETLDPKIYHYGWKLNQSSEAPSPTVTKPDKLSAPLN